MFKDNFDETFRSIQETILYCGSSLGLIERHQNLFADNIKKKNFVDFIAAEFRKQELSARCVLKISPTFLKNEINNELWFRDENENRWRKFKIITAVDCLNSNSQDNESSIVSKRLEFYNEICKLAKKIEQDNNLFFRLSQTRKEELQLENLDKPLIDRIKDALSKPLPDDPLYLEQVRKYPETVSVGKLMIPTVNRAVRNMWIKKILENSSEVDFKK